jgi:hypothetical protein
MRVLYSFATIVLLAASAPIAAQDTVDPAAKLTTALAALADAVPQDSARENGTRALSTPRLFRDPSALPESVRDAIHTRRLRINDADEVQVYILGAVDDNNVAALVTSGATIEIRDAGRRRVQARVPASRLRAIAGLPFVDFIRLPTYARRHTGLFSTEGDKILRADLARQQWSLDGTGVRVGVISDGIKGVFAAGCTTCGGAASGPIATGDLPDAVGVRDASGVLRSSSGGISGRSFQANGDLEGLPPAAAQCAFDGAGAEGTAILEIVHDLAPAAQLSFVNPDTDLAFNQAVDFLAASNDIVLDDLGFFAESYDGTSAVSSNTARALNNPAFPIRGYFTSVGNSADEHYYGAYADSHVDGRTVAGIVRPGNLHLFQQTADTTDVLGLGPQPYNVIALPRGGEVVIFLGWDDPAGGSGNNYDLYLVNQTTGRQVAASTDVQRGAQDPIEFIDYVNTGATALFRIVVQNANNAAQPKHLNLYSFQPECAADGPRTLAPPGHEHHNFNTAAYSVTAQSDAGGAPVSVVSVGAICSASAASTGFFTSAPNASCLDAAHSTVEFFSSRGPTVDGRQKPDVSAIDGVSVSGAGGFVTTFFGTSAAVPHVGAIAALALQAAPCLLDGGRGALDPVAARLALRRTIVDTAVALNDSGAPDNVSGSGRVDAIAAIQGTLPVFTGATTLVVDANSESGAILTAAQIGFADAASCGQTRLAWTGGCGTSPGDALTCPRGTSTVSAHTPRHTAGA